MSRIRTTNYVFTCLIVTIVILFIVLDPKTELLIRVQSLKPNKTFPFPQLNNDWTNKTLSSPSAVSSSVTTTSWPISKRIVKYTESYGLSSLRSSPFLRVDGKVIAELNISQDLRNVIGEEVLQQVPQVFNASFKNPCWQKDKTRCLPYFYLAGIPKSGTTDLFTKIKLHPDIVDGASNFVYHWWTRNRYKNTKFNFYLNGIKLPNLISRNHTLARRLIIGDGSTSLLWDNYQLTLKRNRSAVVDRNPKYTHCDILRVVQPKAKIIAIFRNPTHRLYSDYKYFNNHEKKSPEDFHLRVENSLDTFNNCLQQHNVRTCAYIFKGKTRLNIGIYNIFVRDWLRVFPRQQLYFLRTDEWKDCTSELAKIFTFLEISSLGDSQLASICNQRIRNINNANIGPMLEKTTILLDEFYKPFLEDLATVLNDTRYIWKSDR